MSSGTSLILDSLKRIGAHSVANPASGETISDVKDVLVSMLQIWLSDGIDLGITPINLPGEEVNEPLDTRNAIIENLAVMAGPLFDNGKVVVSETLRANAAASYGKVKDLYQVVTIPNKVVSSTLPLGAGNKNSLSRRTFFKEGAVIKN